jgi:hypothetical protein
LSNTPLNQITLQNQTKQSLRIGPVLTRLGWPKNRPKQRPEIKINSLLKKLKNLKNLSNKTNQTWKNEEHSKVSPANINATPDLILNNKR